MQNSKRRSNLGYKQTVVMQFTYHDYLHMQDSYFVAMHNVTYGNIKST